MVMLAVFDFLVGAMAVLAAISARRKNITDLFSQIGYLSVALAAFIGTTKFLGVGQLAQAHILVSHAAAIVGVPFAAIAFFLVSRETKLWAMLAVGAVVVAGAILFWQSATYALLAGVLAQIIWLWAAWLQRRVPGRILLRVIISVVLTTVAGLVFAGPGLFYGIEKLNIFHGLLALAILQQYYAFSLTSRSE